jgi:hypothetical protein
MLGKRVDASEDHSDGVLLVSIVVYRLLTVLRHATIEAVQDGPPTFRSAG